MSTAPLTQYCITIINTNEEYLCFEGKHLLQGMKSLGKCSIPSGCHGGGCGVCKIQIIKGEVEKVTMSRKHISEKEETNGIYLACCVFPKSDISVKVIGKIKKKLVNKNNNVVFNYG